MILSRGFAFVWIALAASVTSEQLVDVGGAHLAPPPHFQRLHDGVTQGSAALIPLAVGDAPRTLLAAFAEVREGATATLVVGRVDRPLEVDAGTRSAVASAIAGHFRGELDLEVMVDRPAVLQTPGGPRLEAKAHTHAGQGGARIVRFLFVPAGDLHYVLAASLPEEREAELSEAMDLALGSFVPGRVAAALAPHFGHTVLRAAAFGTLGALVALGLQLWRRRRRSDATLSRR